MEPRSNVTPIDPDIEVVGKTAAEMINDIRAVLDEYSGNITNVEAIGALEMIKLDLHQAAADAP